MKFRGEYYFLSNMYPCDIRVKINGHTYTFRCLEAAFQACKCPADAALFEPLDGFAAKRMGQHVQLRPNWDSMKTTIMTNLVRAKFNQNPDLAAKLLETGNLELVEDNTWGDTFWGRCNGSGRNVLGQILMQARYNLYEYNLA